jgi:hypothetical protein
MEQLVVLLGVVGSMGAWPGAARTLWTVSLDLINQPATGEKPAA